MRCSFSRLFLLLAVSLAACHRSSYQFQSSIAPSQLLHSIPMLESAAVSSTLPPCALSSRSRPRLIHTPSHSLKQVVVLSIKAPHLLPHQASSEATSLSASVQARPQFSPSGDQPVRHRSQGVALLLALLSITYIPLSLHNFYLGYYGRGAAAIALSIIGLFLLLAGSISFPFGGGLTPIGYVGLLMLAGWFIWQVSDLVRTITRDLKPKNGEYNNRFF